MILVSVKTRDVGGQATPEPIRQELLKDTGLVTKLRSLGEEFQQQRKNFTIELTNLPEVPTVEY